MLCYEIDLVLDCVDFENSAKVANYFTLFMVFSVPYYLELTQGCDFSL